MPETLNDAETAKNKIGLQKHYDHITHQPPKSYSAILRIQLPQNLSEMQEGRKQEIHNKF